ncbi:MAG TPA: PAS domain S-box protein [Verrucomicrobiae bacterium]
MREPEIKVLLVEDEPAFAELLQEVLRHDRASCFALTCAESLRDTQRRLREDRFDVVLLDLSLPDQCGLRTYTEAHAGAPAVPIVVLTGSDDETLALQAVRDGAQDYLVKGQFDGRTLSRVIRYAIERKRAAEALRESEEFFRLISENVTDLIAVIDCEGKRLYNSPSYKSILGDPSKLPGTNSFEEIHPEDRPRVERIFRDTIATGVGQRTEYRFRLRDGQVRHVESQGSAIRDENGRPAKIVVVSRDITEQKAAVEALRTALADVKKSHEDLEATQQQLIQSERLQAVSTFAAGVAHEVKNPLQTIILGVDYLAHTLVGGDRTADLVLADMNNAVTRANAIIHGLLEFAASRPRAVVEADLNQIVAQSLHTVDSEMQMHPITLQQDLRGGLPPLRVDIKALKHVFIHLFMNSVRTLAGGGTLSVKTYAQRLTAADGQAALKPRGSLRLGDEVVVAEVEETFSNSAPGKSPPTNGIGAGLTVLKKIIELAGGVIDIRSRPGQGNTITLLFRVQSKQLP